MTHFYQAVFNARLQNRKLLAVLIDPEKFDTGSALSFLLKIPKTTNCIFVGGSTATTAQTAQTVKSIKKHTDLPVILFPGDACQITSIADGILFLSLLSGTNPEYLITQQLKSIPKLKESLLEVIPTAYLLIDGGTESAVARVSNTKPLPQDDINTIVNTALAGQYLGKKLIYLEAGSGSKNRVSNEIITAVSNAVDIPLIVGGGIRSEKELAQAYASGAVMVVIGTAFEQDNYNVEL